MCGKLFSTIFFNSLALKKKVHTRLVLGLSFLLILGLWGCGKGAVDSRPVRPADGPLEKPLDPDASLWELGHYQVVKPGMTLWRLAHENGVDLDHLAALNGIIDPTDIEAGTVLWIPGAPGDRIKPADPVRAPGDFAALWPFQPGIGIPTSHFGAPRKGHKHQGVDISVKDKEKVRALAGGTVSWAGKQRGYGKVVYLDHGGGWQTRYAHLDSIKVDSGERVAPGDVLGRAGRTGRTYGADPHLHLEIRFRGKPLDPWPYLRPSYRTN